MSLPIKKLTLSRQTIKSLNVKANVRTGKPAPASDSNGCPTFGAWTCPSGVSVAPPTSVAHGVDE